MKLRNCFRLSWRKITLSLGLMLVSASCLAQSRVTGQVVNEQGDGVEYASIKIDTLYAVSDLQGRFSIDIPKGERKDMVVSHLSYQPVVVPFLSYQKEHFKVTMKEKANDLTAVTVQGKKLKPMKISHKGIKTPGGVSFKNVKNTTYEVGPIVANKKDYLVKSFDFKLSKCTYHYCVIRIIVYEIKGGTLVPIQSKPVYLKFSDKQQKETYSVKPTENIFLQKGHDYYVGVAVVSSNGTGEVSFPAYLRKGYVRNLVSGKMKKLPATMGISLTGVEVQ